MQAGKKAKMETLTRVTRSDVAAAAGVSLTTVTHALNPKPGVRMSAATRERVRRIARHLGYRPNFVGRALVSGRTYTVGLLQPQRESIFSQFYQQMIFGMSESMEPDDYHLLILFRSARERFMKVIDQGRIDGMFVLQSDLATEHIEAITVTGLPLVVVNKHWPVPAGQPGVSVCSDHWRMMTEAVTEFIGAGCRTLLAFHDYRVCDANTHMLEAFDRAVAGAAAWGVTGSTLIPDHARVDRQARDLFRSPLPWDGIFVDGAAVADTLIAQGRSRGFEPGRDYELILTETQPGRTTASRGERAVYCHQPGPVGRKAWQAMRRLLVGESCPKSLLVPYRRTPVRGAREETPEPGRKRPRMSETNES